MSKEREAKRPHEASVAKHTSTTTIANISVSKGNAVADYFSSKAQQELTSKINSDFAFNQQISRDCLPFSVITFPQKGLYEYGLQMNEVPMYRRVNQ